MLNGKATIDLNSWIDKNGMIEYYTERKFLGGRVKFELGLYNYVAKTDFKSATSVVTSKFAKKIDLASLKSDVDLRNLKRKIDKLDVDNIVPVPVYLSKLSDVVKNDVIKKDVYNAKIKNIADKIPDITNLATNTTLNAKINEVKNEIHSITNLATTTALNAKINEVKNKY